MASERQENESVETACDKRRCVTWVVLTVMSVAAAVLVLATPYIPGHDGPHVIYLAHLANHFADPGSIYQRFYEPGAPVTAMGYAFFGAPLQDLFGWQRGFQVYLVLLVELWGWGTVALFRAVSPSRTLWGGVGFLLAFQWALYMGFYGFMIATAIGLFILAFAISPVDWTPRRRVVLSLMLLLQAFAHVFAAQATALVLIVFVLVRSPRGARIKQVAWLALMGIPTMLVMLAASGWSVPGIGTGAMSTKGVSFANKIWLTGYLFAGGPAWRAWVPVLLALTALGLGAYRWRRTGLPRVERALWGAGAVFLLLFVALPFHLSDWQFFAPRFLPMGVTTLLSVLPVEWLYSTKRWRVVIAISAAGYALAALAWTQRFHARLWHQVALVVEATRAPVLVHGVLLPVVFDRSVSGKTSWNRGPYPFYQPLHAVGDLFATTGDRVVPYTFTVSRQLHGFILRDSLSHLFPAHPNIGNFLNDYDTALNAHDRKKVLRVLTLGAIYGSEFDGVILQERTNEHLAFLARGYETMWHKDKTWLFRFRGCPVELVVNGVAPGQQGRVQVSYGWPPVPSMRKIYPSVTSERDSIGVVVAKAPCGPARFRVLAPAQGRGGAPSHCQGANAQGDFVVRLTPNVTKVVCHLVEQP